jgi:hypothetical protein
MVAQQKRRDAPDSRQSTGLPAVITDRQLRVFTTRDVQGVFSSPRPQLKRLTDAGILRRLHGGIFAIVPTEYVGRPWTPPLEAAAIALETARSGDHGAVLMGLSAAHVHGAVPHPLGRATVASHTQRRHLLIDGTTLEVRFVKRRVKELDAALTRTELGDVPVTSIEQTILDLAHPRILEPQAEEERAAIRSLTPRADHVALRELAARHRLGRALRRAQRVSPSLKQVT